MNKVTSLVETSWLSENLDREDICILDCSWHLPSSDRDGRAEFNNRHIPGALFFDIDEVSDISSALPHMLPGKDFFSEKATALGITHETHIIVYDVHGLFSAARVWWMFKTFGHNKISILNGGFKKWLLEGLPVNNLISPPLSKEPYRAKLDKESVVNYAQVLMHIESKDAHILDARSQARFDGVVPEPRAELSSGHMPSSTCVPFASLLQQNGCLKPTAEIEKIYRDAGVHSQSLVLASCGSGVTAAILIFGLHLIGHENAKLYDGSWTEYAAIKGSEILKN